MIIEKTFGFRLLQTYPVPQEGSFSQDAQADGLYINLHTQAFPGGEVRAPLIAEDEDPLIADLPIELFGRFDGDQEVPSVETEAFGFGFAEIGTFAPTPMIEVGMLVWGITLDDTTMLHIHSAPAGSNGGVVLDLDPNDALTSGSPEAWAANGFVPTTQWSGTSAGDTMIGDDSGDAMFGFFGADLLAGADGADFLAGGRSRDTLLGGRGADDINGGRGHDVIRGGRGADTIEGGHGNDLIKLGRGFDTIVFNIGDERGVDVVQDFTAIDTIQLSNAETFRVAVARGDSDALQASDAANTFVLTDAGGLALADARAAVAAVADDGFGTITYFDVDTQMVQTTVTSDLSDAAADIRILARFEGGVGVLDAFDTSTFDYQPGF